MGAIQMTSWTYSFEWKEMFQNNGGILLKSCNRWAHKCSRIQILQINLWNLMKSTKKPREMGKGSFADITSRINALVGRFEWNAETMCNENTSTNTEPWQIEIVYASEWHLKTQSGSSYLISFSWLSLFAAFISFPTFSYAALLPLRWVETRRDDAIWDKIRNRAHFSEPVAAFLFSLFFHFDLFFLL